MRSHKAASDLGLDGPAAEHHLPIFYTALSMQTGEAVKKEDQNINTISSVGRSVNVPRCVFSVWLLFLARPLGTGITPLRNSAPLALSAARSRLRHSIRSYFFSLCIFFFSSLLFFLQYL